MKALQLIGSLPKCGRLCRGGVSSCASHSLRMIFLLVALFAFGWGNTALAETSVYEWDAEKGEAGTTTTLTVTTSGDIGWWKDYSFKVGNSTIKKALKLQSNTTAKFSVKTGKTATVTIGISTKDDTAVEATKSYVNFDGTATDRILSTNQAKAKGTYTYTTLKLTKVAPGEHTITRGETEMGLYYIKVEETDAPVAAPTANFTYGSTSWASPGENDMTINIPAHKGGKTFDVTLSNITGGATAACTKNGTLSGNTLTITAPTSTGEAVAEQTTTVTLTKADATTTTYNIKVTTEAKTGITFNNETRYSQLLIDKRTESFYANTTSSGINSTSGTLDYVPGLVAKAIIEAVDYYKDNLTKDITQDKVKGWFDKVQEYGDSHTIKDDGKNGKSFDDLNAVKLYFGLKSVAASGKLTGITDNTSTATTGWNAKIVSALSGIKTANTNYVITSGTGNADMQGGWWHKMTYTNQMWCDGQYMGTALLAQMINDDQYIDSDTETDNTVTGTKNGDWDLVCKQLDITWKYLWNESTQLIHHAFAADNGTAKTSNMWVFDKKADGTNNYRNEACWARAAGWYFLALVDILEQMDKAKYSGTNYNTILTRLGQLAAGIKARQDAETGCWYQLPLYDGTFSATDCGNGATKTRVYNYLESSATAIFAAAFLKGIRLGYLDRNTYEETAKKAYKGIIEHFMTSEYDIYWSSRSAGLGTDASGAKLRTGSNAYYLKGYDVVPTKVTDNGTSKDETETTTLVKGTEGKVLGAMILAAVEYERQYMSNSKTVKVNFADPCHEGDTSAETEYRGKISVKVGDTDYTTDAKSGASIPVCSEVTLTATAYDKESAEGCPQYNKKNNLYFSFYAWKNRADGTILSTNSTYTISSLDADVDIVAVFRHASNNLTFAKATESAVDVRVEDGSTSTTKSVTFAPADAGKQYVIDVTNTTNSVISALYNGSTLSWYYQNGKLYLTVPAEGTETYFGLQTTSEDGNKVNKHIINVKTSNSTTPTYNAVINYTVSVNSTEIALGTGGNSCENANITPQTGVISATVMTSNSAKEELSAKIVSDEGEWTGNLHPLTATYTVADNNKFTPGEIRIPVQSISTTKSYRVVMEDNAGHKIQQDISNVYDGALIDLVVKNTEGVIFTGDVTLKLYCFGATDGYRLANPIAISGNVASLNTESNDATLKKLSYNGLEIALQEGEYDYSAKAISNVKPEIAAEPNDPDAKSVLVTYPEGFSESGVVTITVTAADGTTTQTYTVTFTASDPTPVSNVTWNFYQNESNNGAWNVATDSDGNLYRLNYTINGNGDAVDNSGLYFKGSSLNGNGGRTVSFTGISGLGRVIVDEQLHCGQFNVREDTGDPLAVGYHTANYTTGTSTAYTYSDGKTYYIDFIGQVRIRSIVWMPETEENVHSYTVSATSSNASYGTASATPSGGVQEGTKVVFTATANTGYEFVNWTDASGNVVATTATYTIYNLSAAAELTANFVATKTTQSGTATFTIEQLNYFAGTVHDPGVKTQYTTSDGYITLASSSSNVQAQMTSNKGTKVRNTGSFTITPASGATISKVTLITDQSSRNLTASPEATPTRDGSNYTYTFSDLSEAITFTNSNSDNIYVTSINVEYEYTPTVQKTQLNATFAGNITGYVGDNGIAIPALTVTAGGNAMTEGTDYTVTYQSSNTSAVTISAGKVNLVAAGSAVVTAVITPVNSGQYAATTATFTVTSQPLLDLVVDVPDVTMYSTATEVTQPRVTVYALVNGQNVALTEGTDYTFSFAIKTSAKPANLTGGSSIAVTGSPGSYTAGNNVVTVTVTPTPAGVNTYHCKATTKDFSYNVVTAGQKVTPTIVVSDNISYQVDTAKPVTVSVVYDGNDITDLFDFSSTLSTEGYTVEWNKNVFTFTPGSTVNSTGIILTITATPIDDYADQYATATKQCTLKIVDNALLIEAELSVTKVKIGDNIYFTSVVVKDKTTGTIFSIDDEECAVEYQSSAPSVLAINASTGVMTPLAEGEATVKIIARKNEYASASWTQTVTVIDPTVYKAAAKSGETAPANGTVVTDVEGIAMTYGGWVFKSGVTRTLTSAAGKEGSEETFGNKKWGNSGSDGAGSLPNFKYSFMGNSHQNPRDEMGANALPENYTNIGYTHYQANKPLDPMFNVPVEGAYITFAPKTNGTVIAHVLQEGAFSGSYKSEETDETKKNKLIYRRDRRVMVLDEMGHLHPNLKATLDVTTGKLPKDDSDKSKVMTKVTLYSRLIKTSAPIETPKTLTTDYDFTKDFIGFNGFEFSDNKITNFQNGLYKLYGNEGNPNYGTGDGWGVLVKAPVTYEFEVKAGKTYYLYNYGSKINVFGFQFKPASTVTVDKVTYKEKENNAVTQTAAGHVASVSLDRQFVVGQWNAAVLPFSLNKQQVDAIFGRTFDKDNQDGTQILYFEKTEGRYIYYTRHAYNTLVAGRPFLIKPSGKNANGDPVATVTDGKIVLNTANVPDFPYVTIESTMPTEWKGRRGEEDDYCWQSGYNVQTINPGDYYINAAGSLIMRESSDAKLQSFRSYLKKKNPSASAKLFSVAYFDMLSDNADIPSKIEDMLMDSDGNVIHLSGNGYIYNLNGQVVSTDPTSLDSLPKGVYILNGKKYVVE